MLRRGTELQFCVAIVIQSSHKSYVNVSRLKWRSLIPIRSSFPKAISNCEFALVLFLVAAHYLIFLRSPSDSFEPEQWRWRVSFLYLIFLLDLNHIINRVWIVPCGRQSRRSRGDGASMYLFQFAGSNNFASILFLLWILCFDFVISGRCRRFGWWMWLKTALNSTSIASITSGTISSFNIHFCNL